MHTHRHIHTYTEFRLVANGMSAENKQKSHIVYKNKTHLWRQWDLWGQPGLEGQSRKRQLCQGEFVLWTCFPRWASCRCAALCKRLQRRGYIGRAPGNLLGWRSKIGVWDPQGYQDLAVRREGQSSERSLLVWNFRQVVNISAALSWYSHSRAPGILTKLGGPCVHSETRKDLGLW